ncbi:MAG: class II aldolase/adducin family protein [Acidobacteria bacterium]|nr:class II aldolase/adducin family protein [Acidobacteriota bacterium]
MKTCVLRRFPLVAIGVSIFGVGFSGFAQQADSEKEKLVLANRILAVEGLVGPYGHVSVRSSNPEKLWIASHRSPDEVDLKDLVEVELNVTPETVRERNLPSEIFIHTAIYKELREVGSVVHTHSPQAVALGVLRHIDNRVLPTTNSGANLGNFIPVFAEIGLIQDVERGSKLARSIQQQSGILLRGHGTVTLGKGLEQAVLRAIYLEVEARTQIAARQAGEPIFLTPQESDLFKETRAIEHAWEYYVHKVRSH